VALDGDRLPQIGGFRSRGSELIGDAVDEVHVRLYALHGQTRLITAPQK